MRFSPHASRYFNTRQVPVPKPVGKGKAIRERESDPDIVYIKQYSARRCGSCYTAALMLANFKHVDVLVTRMGHKHDPPQDMKNWIRRGHYEAMHRLSKVDEFRYTVNIKNPYSAVFSNLRWLMLEGFLDEFEDLGMVERICVAHNILYDSWLSVLKKRLSFMVRYEDLIQDYGKVLGAMQEKLELEPSRSPFVNIKRRVNPTGDRQRTAVGDMFADSLEFYREEKYLHMLSDKCKELIGFTIDWELYGEYGYKPLSEMGGMNA